MILQLCNSPSTTLTNVRSIHICLHQQQYLQEFYYTTLKNGSSTIYQNLYLCLELLHHKRDLVLELA
jgi:hypothetical protein